MVKKERDFVRNIIASSTGKIERLRIEELKQIDNLMHYIVLLERYAKELQLENKELEYKVIRLKDLLMENGIFVRR